MYDEQGCLVGGFDGTAVVQTHMTNSRLTDPEAFEFRFSVRLLGYALHKRSGGTRRWRGGDGGVRRVMFLELTPASCPTGACIRPLAQQGARTVRPGSTAWCVWTGSIEVLQRIVQVDMQGGDVFEIHTPGGGGFGAIS